MSGFDATLNQAQTLILKIVESNEHVAYSFAGMILFLPNFNYFLNWSYFDYLSPFLIPYLVIYLYLYLFNYLFIYLFIYLFVCLFIY